MAFGLGPDNLTPSEAEPELVVEPEQPAKPPRRKRRWVIGGVIVLVVIAGLYLVSRPKAAVAIHNFRECADYGYPVSETFPETCTIPGGTTFTDTAVQTGGGDTKNNLTYNILVDSMNGPADAAAKVIDKASDWPVYWNKTHAYLNPIPPILAVDFSKYMVAAIHLGSQSTDGYRIRVTNIYEVSKETVIEAKKVVPGKGCVLPDHPIAPYEIVQFTRTTKPTVFDIQTEAGTACATPDPSAGVGKY